MNKGIDEVLRILEKHKPSYGYYYPPPRCGKTLLSEMKKKQLNCSDQAPHEKEINLLLEMGLSPKQIMRIIYGNQFINKVEKECQD